MCQAYDPAAAVASWSAGGDKRGSRTTNMVSMAGELAGLSMGAGRRHETKPQGEKWRQEQEDAMPRALDRSARTGMGEAPDTREA